MADISDYIGRGIIFPVELTPQGFPIYRGGIILIESSIKMILSSRKKQRIFLSKFASDLETLLGEPNDEVLTGLAEQFIFDALQEWEARIQVLDTGATRTTPERLDINLKYKERISNLERVLTFPFYKQITF